MRRFSKMILWGGLVAALGVGVAPAQLLNEIMRGAVLNQPTDMFGCGTLGNAPCGLGYRIYSSYAPMEINGPANPVDGNPRYATPPVGLPRYVSDGQSTANYPLSQAGGAGKEWYVAWDGITGAGTTAHAGWYGAQAQKVNFFEIGNSLSLNCLPVVAQEACFRALSPASTFNDTVRADGSALSHVGGISPIPCPHIVSNGLADIELQWEQANNFTTTDGASIPVQGTMLYAVRNPVGAQTDADLAGGAVPVASFARTSTSVVIPRSDPALVSGSVFSFANKIRLAGGHDSTQFSCNSALSGGGFCVNDPVGDAASAVDIERICAEVRTDGMGKEYVVLTYDIVGDMVGLASHDRIQFTASMELGGIIARVDARALNAVQSARAGSPVVMRFSGSNFNPPLLASLSSVDDTYGRIVFVIDADALVAKLGARTFNLSARVKIPGADDTESFSFSF